MDQHRTLIDADGQTAALRLTALQSRYSSVDVPRTGPASVRTMSVAASMSILRSLPQYPPGP